MDVVPLLVFVAVFVVLIGVFFWVPGYLRRHPHKRFSTESVPRNLVGGFDELYNPHAATARDLIEQEHRFVAPAPAPDDDLGVSGRAVRIVVAGDERTKSE
jgi:hypothetical protein